MMKDFVKVIKNEKIEDKSKINSVVMRQYLGTITYEDKDTPDYEISTDLKGVGLMIEDAKGNIIGLDSHKFIGYIVDHFQEILDEDTKNKEES